MRGKIISQISAWMPVIAWGFLIFHLSSGKVPVASSVYWQDFAVKKTGHLILFGILAILLYRALRINHVNRKTSAFCAVFLALFYGFTDEVHQIYTQGREARVRDVFIDGIGATIAVVTLYYLPAKLTKKIFTFVQKFNLV